MYNYVIIEIGDGMYRNKYLSISLALILLSISSFFVIKNSQNNNKVSDEEIKEEVTPPSNNNIPLEKKLAIKEERKELTGKYLDKEYYLKLFKLDGNLSCIEEINEDILDNYQDIEKMINEEDDIIGESSYSFTMNSSVASLMIKYYIFVPGSSSKKEEYYTYNVSLDDEKILSDLELLKLYSVDVELLKETLKSEYKVNNVNISNVYLDKEEKINIIFPISLEGKILYKVYKIV